MARINKTRINFKRLDSLIESLDKNVSIRVGIIGEKARQQHPNSNLTNAELGAIHEYGSTFTLPERDVSVYRSIDSDGNFKYGGRFRKKNAKSTNWQEDYHLGESEVVIPTRSFLRMPLLSDEGRKAVRKETEQEIKKEFKKLFGKDSWGSAWENEYLYGGNEYIVEKIADTFGTIALKRVHEAFETSGFGNWSDITEATRRQRKGDKNNPPLEDTGDLKDSITYEVKIQ